MRNMINNLRKEENFKINVPLYFQKFANKFRETRFLFKFYTNIHTKEKYITYNQNFFSIT